MGTDFTSRFWNETPDAIIAMSPDGRVLHWNRAAETIFGYTPEEAAGRTLTDLIVPPGHVEEELRQAIEAIDAGDLAPGLRITASIGVAGHGGLPNYEKMVSLADQRLYEAKNAGRNRVAG